MHFLWMNPVYQLHIKRGIDESRLSKEGLDITTQFVDRVSVSPPVHP